MIRDIVDR